VTDYENLDPYQLLGVAPGAGEAEIRTAWREAARRHHPDTGGDGEIFKRCQWAFEMLTSGTFPKNETRRGREEDRESGDMDAPEVEHDGEVGEKVMVEALVDHPTAVFGGVTRFTRWRLTHCPVCFGRGTNCDECNGDGRVGGYHQSIVDIPARTVNGDIIRIVGEGDAGRRRRNDSGRGVSNTGPYGEVMVRVLVQREPWIVEIGDDLRTEVTVDVYDAILGGEVRVRGLDGAHNLTIPPGIQPGQQLRIFGRGRPKEGGGRGDLVVVIQVEIVQDLAVGEASTLSTLRRERRARGGKAPKR